MIQFEFDKKKSESNKIKHGIDFIEAQALWDDSNLIEIPAKIIDELRFMVIGKIGMKHWSGIITYRGNKLVLFLYNVLSKRRSKYMKAKDFDKAFDEGSDITQYLDISKARRPQQEKRKYEY
jgi:uncharacterized DUF497 family protein